MNAETRIPRCQAAVSKRDTTRYTGRGRGGFEMHYTRAQCSRAAKVGDLCRTHAKWPECARAGYRPFVERAAKETP